VAVVSKDFNHLMTRAIAFVRPVGACVTIEVGFLSVSAAGVSPAIASISLFSAVQSIFDYFQVIVTF
jgi:hypothetical protein